MNPRNKLHVVVALMLSSLLCGLCACGATALQIQARTADSIARAANAALPTLIDTEEEQGNVAIDTAHSAAEAASATDAIETRWRPFWTAWGVMRTTQDQWAILIDRARGNQPVNAADVIRLLGTLRSAWCDVRASVPPPSSIPDLPLIPCPAPSTDAGVTDAQ